MDVAREDDGGRLLLKDLVPRLDDHLDHLSVEEEEAQPVVQKASSPADSEAEALLRGGVEHVEDVEHDLDRKNLHRILPDSEEDVPAKVEAPPCVGKVERDADESH